MRSSYFLLLFITLILIGETGYSQGYKNEFGFRNDNDAYLFYGQDRYYTNGLDIFFRRAIDQSKLGPKLEKITYEIYAGQKIFNPFSGNVEQKAYQDRPFAGYLYAGWSNNFFYKNEKVIKTTVELGTVGPNSQGEKAQKLLHNTVGFYEVNGWDYQIQNELTANVSLQYMQLLHRSESEKIDFSFDSYANLGTTFTGAGVGILMRTGAINSLFQSASTKSLIEHNGKKKDSNKPEFFFYLKPQLNYVAYDATVQGSLFREEKVAPTFDVKPFVFSQHIGAIYSNRRFTFQYDMTFKSKEIESTAKPHQYGTISMYYRFN